MERQKLLTLYSFAVYTCYAYGRCLTLPGQRSWWFTIGSQCSVRTFSFERWRIWRPKQNAWLNGQNSLHESYKHFRSWIFWMESFFLEMTLFCRFIIDPSRVKLSFTRITQRIHACFAYQGIKWREVCSKVFKLLSEKTAQVTEVFYLCIRHDKLPNTVATIGSRYLPNWESAYVNDCVQFTVSRFGQLALTFCLLALLFLHA